MINIKCLILDTIKIILFFLGLSSSLLIIEHDLGYYVLFISLGMLFYIRRKKNEVMEYHKYIKPVILGVLTGLVLWVIMFSSFAKPSELNFYL